MSDIDLSVGTGPTPDTVLNRIFTGDAVAYMVIVQDRNGDVHVSYPNDEMAGVYLLAKAQDSRVSFYAQQQGRVRLASGFLRPS